MKIKLLFIQDGECNRKLRQVKFIKELFGLGLKEAKDAVDSGEFIPRCECNASLVEMIRSSSHNIKVETLPSSVEEEAFQLIVYSHLQNLFPQDKSKYVLIAKEEYDALTKYKALYLDIVGTLGTIVKQFTNS
jgi:hypothetical protein